MNPGRRCHCGRERSSSSSRLVAAAGPRSRVGAVVLPRSAGGTRRPTTSAMSRMLPVEDGVEVAPGRRVVIGLDAADDQRPDPGLLADLGHAEAGPATGLRQGLADAHATPPVPSGPRASGSAALPGAMSPSSPLLQSLTARPASTADPLLDAQVALHAGGLGRTVRCGDSEWFRAAGPVACRAIIARLRREGTESPVRTADLPSMNRVLWPAELSAHRRIPGPQSRPDFTTVSTSQPTTTRNAPPRLAAMAFPAQSAVWEPGQVPLH